MGGATDFIAHSKTANALDAFLRNGYAEGKGVASISFSTLMQGFLGQRRVHAIRRQFRKDLHKMPRHYLFAGNCNLHKSRLR